MERKCKDQLYYPGMPDKIELPEVPIHYLLKGSKEQYGNKTAYIFQDQSLTFNELYNQAWSFANALKDLGIKKGDVVLVYLPTCLEFIPMYYGIVISGAVFSPINPLSSSEDLLYHLLHSQAKCVIAHESNAAALNPIIHDTQVTNVIIMTDDNKGINDGWISFKSLIQRYPSTEFDVGINPKEDLAHIPYTGGTTGKPKGVMQTHYNSLSATLLSAAWTAGVVPEVKQEALILRRIEPDEDKYLKEYRTLPGTNVKVNISPLYHATGMGGVLQYSVLIGATTVLLDRFDPGKYLECLEKYRATEITGAPTMFSFLMRHPDINTRDLSSVRFINSGAAPISEELMKALQARFPDATVTEAYGLTEATGLVASCVAFQSGFRKLESVGIPVYNTEVKLVSLDGESEEPMPAGDEGEMWVRGPQIIKGYYGDPEGSKQILTSDGWLKTGDIARWDEDGMLSIVDRKKDMLIYKGYNVYPRELEEILYQLPDVVQASVIGKPSPDVGEIPKAYVVLKQGSNISEREILDYVNEKVLPYKKIRELVITEQLPISPAGKILKRVLRAM